MFSRATGRVDSPRRGADEAPRVLAISDDSFALLDLRVNNPLRALQRQGRIQGFAVSNTSFGRLAMDSASYDVVLIQRTVPESVYQALADAGVPFLLDIDDNVLARASFRAHAATEKALLAGLRCATVVTATTSRLIELLEKYSGVAIASKACLVPNGLPFPNEIRNPTAPTHLLWIQSDIAALTASRRDVIRAVDDFSNRFEIPVVLVGRSVLEQPQFSRQIVMGEVDFVANLQLLEFGPTSIGVAPLETRSDPETSDFVAGKSDLKILLFDGYGHPGIYSDYAPYIDSPFRSGVTTVRNSYGDWMDALKHQYEEGWRSVKERSQPIRDCRHIDRVARECWWPALRSVRMPQPVPAGKLYRLLSAACSNSEVQMLKRQLDDLRNSFSWRITAPLRRLARPFMHHSL